MNQSLSIESTTMNQSSNIETTTTNQSSSIESTTTNQSSSIEPTTTNQSSSTVVMPIVGLLRSSNDHGSRPFVLWEHCRWWLKMPIRAWQYLLQKLHLNAVTVPITTTENQRDKLKRLRMAIQDLEEKRCHLKRKEKILGKAKIHHSERKLNLPREKEELPKLWKELQQRQEDFKRTQEEFKLQNSEHGEIVKWKVGTNWSRNCFHEDGFSAKGYRDSLRSVILAEGVFFGDPEFIQQQLMREQEVFRREQEEFQRQQEEYQRQQEEFQREREEFMRQEQEYLQERQRYELALRQIQEQEVEFELDRLSFRFEQEQQRRRVLEEPRQRLGPE